MPAAATAGGPVGPLRGSGSESQVSVLTMMHWELSLHSGCKWKGSAGHYQLEHLKSQARLEY